MEVDRSGAGIILCVGTSHRVAPVRFLERAALGAGRLRRAFSDCIRRGEPFSPALLELVVLSTCNRVELYAATPMADVAATGSCLAGILGVSRDEASAAYRYAGEEAIRHLCRVAAGLDSMVVGEPQIAGQVARAFESVLHRNGSAPILAAAARTARTASSRVRAETAISRKPASLSSVAVHVAAERLGGLRGARVVVVGAGKIGRLACQALRDAGADLTIVNRTLARAESVAARVGARALPLGALGELITSSDVIVASTSSPAPVIDAGMVRAAIAERQDSGPCVVIDIAVPRNVAVDVADLPGVDLLDIDDLRDRVRCHLEERRDEIPRAEAIIDEVVATRGQADGALIPTIGDLRRRAERIRNRILERTLHGLGDVDAETRARIEHLSRALVNRLLHDPTARLRSAVDEGRGVVYASLVRELFALDDPGEQLP